MDVAKIKAAWAEWEAASAEAEAAWDELKRLGRKRKASKTTEHRRKVEVAIVAAESAWAVSMTRTNAARLAVGGDLPSLEEVDFYLAEQRAIAEADTNQGRLI